MSAAIFAAAAASTAAILAVITRLAITGRRISYASLTPTAERNHP